MEKNNLLKQFICLVEIPFYAIFPKTWVLQVSKTTLENGQMGYIGWSITNYFELTPKVFHVSGTSRQRKFEKVLPWDVWGRI